MRKTFLLLIILLGFKCLAQDKCIVITPPYEASLTHLGDNSAYYAIDDFDFSNAEHKMVTFFLGDTNYAFVNCKSDWYQYIDNVWVNLYKLNNHGFTCSPVLFIEQGKPHLFGGYGIWRGQSLNIKMNGHGEWNDQRSFSTPENYMPFLGIKKHDSTVILLGGKKVNSMNNLNSIITTGYRISSNQEWNEVEFLINHEKSIIGNKIAELFTDRYRISINTVEDSFGIYVYDSHYGDFTLSRKDWTAEGSEQFYLSGDSLVISSGRVIHFHIPDLIKEGKQIVISDISTFPNKYWLFTLILIPLAWILKKARIKQTNMITSPDFYDEMLARKGNAYTGEELNEIFGIGHLNYDQVRKKRASILQSINDFHFRLKGKHLINRIRDESDKRHIIYVVDKD